MMRCAIRPTAAAMNRRRCGWHVLAVEVVEWALAARYAMYIHADVCTGAYRRQCDFNLMTNEPSM